MKPYKARESYGEVANQFNIPEEDVKVINNYYWKVIRGHLTDLVNPSVTIMGLGDMVIKPWSLTQKIKSLTFKKEKWEASSTGSSIFESYAADLGKVINMTVMVDKEKKKQEYIKEKRRIYDLQ